MSKAKIFTDDKSGCIELRQVVQKGFRLPIVHGRIEGENEMVRNPQKAHGPPSFIVREERLAEVPQYAAGMGGKGDETPIVPPRQFRRLGKKPLMPLMKPVERP
jgi:hypothetical protein